MIKLKKVPVCLISDTPNSKALKHEQWRQGLGKLYFYQTEIGDCMLDQDFCEFLEYETCKAFESSDNEQTKGFWCDGILLNQPDSQYSKKFINGNRQISLKAFIGENGQTAYESTLKFGKKAQSRFARNLDIKECVPNPNKPNWFDIDTERHKIVIQLD